MVVAAGGGAVVEKSGRAGGVSGFDEGAGQGVLDDLSFHAYSSDAFGLVAEGGERVSRGAGAAGCEVGQCPEDGGQDLVIVGARVGGSPAGQLFQVLGRGLHGEGQGQVEGVEDFRHPPGASSSSPT